MGSLSEIASQAAAATAKLRLSRRANLLAFVFVLVDRPQFPISFSFYLFDR